MLQTRGLHFRHTDNINYFMNSCGKVGLPKVSNSSLRKILYVFLYSEHEGISVHFDVQSVYSGIFRACQLSVCTVLKLSQIQ